MLRQVQPLYFLFFGDTQTDQKIGQLQKHRCADNRQAPGDRDADQLIHELMRISVQHPNTQGPSGRVVKDRIHGGNREDSRKERAQCSAGAVDTKGVEGVVVS